MRGGVVSSSRSDFFRVAIMIIAIDWDNTITRDVALFKAFIELANQSGHKTIVITGRQPNDQIVPPFPIEVIYAGDRWKRDAAAAAGYAVDIWIDDSPGVIMPQQKLEW